MNSSLTFAGIQVTDVKKTFLAVMLSAVMLVTAACPFNSSWVTQAQNILQVVLPAVINIITLITAFSGKGVSAEDILLATKVGKEVDTDLKTIGKLIDDYNAAGADKTTLLDKLTVAVKTAQDDMGSLLPALHIRDQALLDKITAVVGVVLSEIASIQSLIPLIKTGKANRATMKAAGVKSASEFKAEFNATMTKPTGDVPVDAVAKTLAVK